MSVLTSKEDEELQSFLLQLVQALRYERADSSRLSRFLIDRALANPHFAIILHWYLFCGEMCVLLWLGLAQTLFAEILRVMLSGEGV